MSQFLVRSLCMSMLMTVGLGVVHADAFPWTMQNAEQLARKTLFSPTPAIIQQLYDAGSASGAVLLLFPDQA